MMLSCAAATQSAPALGDLEAPPFADQSVNSDDRPSTPDAERRAEPWTRAREDLLHRWILEWKSLCDLHAVQSENFNNKQFLLAVPSVALPLVFAPVSNGVKTTSCDTNAIDLKDMFLAIGFVLCSVTAAFNAYFRWGEKAVMHWETSKTYAKLVSDAEEVLATERKYRIEAAVALRTLKVRSDSILASSSLLPIALRQRLNRSDD